MKINQVEKAVRKLHDTKSAAAYLGGFKENTLEGWRVKGIGPKYFKIGHLIRYDEEEHLDAYLLAQTRTSTSQA